MTAERERLICCLIGLFIGMHDKTLNGTDLRILIDQYLIEHNQPPTDGTEKELLIEIESEVMWSIMTAKINRKERRNITNKIKVRT